MNLVEDSVSTGVPFSKHDRKARSRHHQHEEILRFVQQAPDDINWTIFRAEFDDLLASQKDSAPGPDGIPYGVYRCAGGLGSKFLFRSYKAVLEGSSIGPSLSLRLLMERIIRSPDALRPLTLQLRLQTPYICYLSRPFTGTLCNAFTLHRDASPLGK